MKITYIVAILLGLFSALYEKTNIVFFDYMSIILGIIVVVLTIYNILMLVENKTNYKKWHLFDNLFFMLLGYTYVFLKLII